jgi:hypothetical protein
MPDWEIPDVALGLGQEQPIDLWSIGFFIFSAKSKD